MIEFLQAYGVWILFGLFFLVMMRMHGSPGGTGCGMGGHDHGSHDEPAAEKREDQGEEEPPHKSGSCH